MRLRTKRTDETAGDEKVSDLTALVADYTRDGFVVVDDLVPHELLEEAWYGVQRVHAGERDTTLPSGLGYLDWTPDDPSGTRINDYVSLQNEEIRRLVTHRPIAAMASLLAGSSPIRLFHDQVIYKDPGTPTKTNVGFHTDRAYWHTCSSLSMLTAWVPLTNCSEEHGPLRVVRGSHLWGTNDDLAGFWTGDGTGRLDGVAAPAPADHEVVTLALQPGQVSFHHCRMVHGSGPNRATGPRCAVTIHLQDADNRYVAPAGRDRRTVHVNDLLCRTGEDGSPDYSDPFVSPVLFDGSRTEAETTVDDERLRNRAR